MLSSPSGYTADNVTFKIPLKYLSTWVLARSTPLHLSESGDSFFSEFCQSFIYVQNLMAGLSKYSFSFSDACGDLSVPVCDFKETDKTGHTRTCHRPENCPVLSQTGVSSRYLGKNIRLEQTCSDCSLECFSPYKKRIF